MMRVFIAALAVTLAAGGCATADEASVAPMSVVTAPPVQRGLVLPTWEKHGYRDTATDEALVGIAAVGANWVQVVPTWYQATPTSSDIDPRTSTVDDADLRHVIELAHTRGLKVLLKPHVDIDNSGDRARINPTDRDAWFSSYRRFITHYSVIATELGVDQFAVGTELAGVSGDRSRWLETIADVRESYFGQLVYAANHSEYATVAFWDAVDLIGVDAYWSLSKQPTTDVALLRHALESRRGELAALSERVGRRILFTEAGFASQRGSTTAPWSASVSGLPAQDEQAAAYEAMLATFTGQPWWAGVFFWTWSVSQLHDLDPPEAVDHSVRGKAAQSVLHDWWAPELGSRAADSTAR